MQIKHGALSTIVSVDANSNVHYAKEFKQIIELKSLKVAKKQHVVSYLDSKSFITTPINVSSNIPDEDLQEVIEDRTYSELGLDMASEFIIQYFEMPAINNDGIREYQIFVVDPQVIHDKFDPIADKTEYINAIYPLPLLMRSLYKRDIIVPSGVHCFLYFQQNDASLTIYKNGEYIYTKSIKYSYEHLHERFCEMIGERIDYNTFVSKIAEEGLKSTNAESQEHLMNLFGELFLYINDILTYTKRAFSIENFDKLYIGSHIGPILGIDEYSHTYLNMGAEDFDFNYGFETTQWYIDQMHLLMQLTYDLDENERYDCNFTLFTPPPPFTHRSSGKIILTTLASTVLALAYPVYNLANNSLATNQIDDLLGKYKIMHEKRLNHERLLSEKMNKRKNIQQRIDVAKSELKEKKQSLKKIHDKKVNYPMKGLILAELTSTISRFHVRIHEIKYDEKSAKTFAFHLYSTDEKDITKLIEEFTKNKANTYLFDTKKIFLNDKKNGYESILQVTIK